MEIGFLIKKYLAAFLSPLSIILALFFIGLIFLYFNKIKESKLFLSFSFILLILISLNPFSTYLLQNLEQEEKTYKYEEGIKFIHVLGHGNTEDKEYSDISNLSQTALMRLAEGIRIHNLHNNSKLILSGYKGFGKKISHAIWLKNAALVLGVKEENIILLKNTKDTQEEAFFCKKIVKDEKVVVVTSASHMNRAIKYFIQNRVNYVKAPTNYMASYKATLKYTPNAQEIKKVEISMHEYLGNLWQIIKSFKYIKE